MKARLLLLIWACCALLPHPAAAGERLVITGEVFAESATLEGTFVSNRVFGAVDRATWISNKSVPFGLPDHPLGRRFGSAVYRLAQPVVLQNDPDVAGDATLQVRIRRGVDDTQAALDLTLVTGAPEQRLTYRIRTQSLPTDRYTEITVDLDNVHGGPAPQGRTLTVRSLQLSTAARSDQVTQATIASIALHDGSVPVAAPEPAVARLNAQTFDPENGGHGAALLPGVVSVRGGIIALDNGSVSLDKPMRDVGGPRFARVDLHLNPVLTVANDPARSGDAYLEVVYRRGLDDEAGIFFLRALNNQDGKLQSFSYRVAAKAHDVQPGDKAFSTVRIDLDAVHRGHKPSGRGIELAGLGVYTPWRDNRRTQIEIAEVRLVRPDAEGPAAKAPALPDVPAVARLNANTYRSGGEGLDGGGFPGVIRDRGGFLSIDTGRIPKDEQRDHNGGPHYMRMGVELAAAQRVANDPNRRGDVFLELDYRLGPDNETEFFLARLVDQDGKRRQSFNYLVRAADTGARPGDPAFTRVRIDLDDVGPGTAVGEMDLGLVRLSLTSKWGETRRTQFDLLEMRVVRGDDPAPDRGRPAYTEPE